MKNKSRTSLVLMELIITILFFSVCSAVCVQLFVQSHLIDKSTRELNNAMSKAQGFAEVMRGTDGSMASIEAEYPNAVGDGESYFEIYYDEDFKEIDPSLGLDSALYAADVTLERVSKIQNMYINIVDLTDYEAIYSLNATKYIRETPTLEE